MSGIVRRHSEGMISVDTKNIVFDQEIREAIKSTALYQDLIKHVEEWRILIGGGGESSVVVIGEKNDDNPFGEIPL